MDHSTLTMPPDMESPCTCHGLVRECQTSCEPRQRALISWMAICHKHELRPAELIASFAQDVPRTALEKRRRTRKFFWSRVGLLANELTEHPSFPTALEKFPGLLPNTIELAIRLESEKGTLPQFYQAWLNRDADAGFETNRQTKSFFGRLIPLFLLTLTIVSIAVLIGIRNVPVFQDIAEEFDFEFDERFEIVLFWLLDGSSVILGLMLFSLPLIVLALPGYFRRWNPFIWRQPIAPSWAANRKALAMICEHGKTVPADALKYFRRLQRVLTSDANSASDAQSDLELDWMQLASRGIISRPEAQVLQTAKSPLAQAWLIQKMLDRQFQQQFDRRAIWNRTWETLVQLVLVAIVALLAFMVFWFLIQVMATCSDWM